MFGSLRPGQATEDDAKAKKERENLAAARCETSPFFEGISLWFGNQKKFICKKESFVFDICIVEIQ